MSRIEHHIGRAIEICIDLPTYKEKRDYAIKHMNMDTDLEEDYITDDNFFYLKSTNQLFKLDNHKEDEYGHCIVTTRHTLNGNPVYDFVLSFYNGGGSFEEIFEASLKESIEK